MGSAFVVEVPPLFELFLNAISGIFQRAFVLA